MGVLFNFQFYKFGCLPSLQQSFVKNVWLHEFPPSEGPLHLVLFIFMAMYISCDFSLEVFVSLNVDNRDVYSAKYATAYQGM